MARPKRSDGAKALKRALQKRQLTYELGAHLLGVNEVTLWRWLSGHTSPSNKDACKIEDTFGVYHRMWVQ